MSTITARNDVHNLIPLLRLLRQERIIISVAATSDGPRTLTIRAVTRVDTNLRAHEYQAGSDFPPPIAALPLSTFPNWTFSLLESVTLCPAQMLIDLFQLKNVEILNVAEGAHLLTTSPHTVSNRTWSTTTNCWTIPSITILIGSHNLTNVFSRLFHRSFYSTLLTSAAHESQRFTLSDCGVTRLVGRNKYNNAPTVQYLRDDYGGMYAIRLKTWDTNKPFGPISFDQAYRTFARVDSTQNLSTSPEIAINNALGTLLTFEGMERSDKALWALLGLETRRPKVMKDTLAGRMKALQFAAVEADVEHSDILRSKQNLIALQNRSGSAELENLRPPQFAKQVPIIHGGLLLNRSPHQLLHHAKDQLAEIDVTSCYGTILSTCKLYIGKPVVIFPGQSDSSGLKFTLRQSVNHIQTMCDDDAWFCRITGDHKLIANALIPSTVNAVTSANYQVRRKSHSRGTLTAQSKSRLYSSVVESGVITNATLTLINAFPEHAREELMNCEVECMCFYPRDLVGHTPQEFDQKYRGLHNDGLPFSQEFNAVTLDTHIHERADQNSVVHSFDIGALVTKLVNERKKAKKLKGPGSAEELTLKVGINTLYGVQASKHSRAYNWFLATIINAKARAIAYAITQSLNSLQTITDGAIIRLDRVPRGTFHQLLALNPSSHLPRTDTTFAVLPSVRSRPPTPSTPAKTK